jgi:hypothetical protein
MDDEDFKTDLNEDEDYETVFPKFKSLAKIQNLQIKV